uniref:Uncharacterized protein n=1 Tax=Ascaris lumbricoides TaxID=6252 RepID=A0A0M3I7Z5_ASCLU
MSTVTEVFCHHKGGRSSRRLCSPQRGCPPIAPFTDPLESHRVGHHSLKEMNRSSFDGERAFWLNTFPELVI